MNEMPMANANALASLMANNSFGGLSIQDHLHKVSGIEGMNLFQTRPSSEYALFEENSNVFCCKTTDAANTPTYRYFAFQEISKEEAMQEISPYLMKGELDSFKENVLSAIRGELSQFKEEIINAQQSVRNNGNANNGNGSKSGNIQQRNNRNSESES